MLVKQAIHVTTRLSSKVLRGLLPTEGALLLAMAKLHSGCSWTLQVCVPHLRSQSPFQPCLAPPTSWLDREQLTS